MTCCFAQYFALLTFEACSFSDGCFCRRWCWGGSGCGGGGVWWLRWLLCVGCSFFILCRRRGLRWVGGGSGRFRFGPAFFLTFGTAR